MSRQAGRAQVLPLTMVEGRPQPGREHSRCVIEDDGTGDVRSTTPENSTPPARGTGADRPRPPTIC